jgi:hypothetical protein
VALAPERDGPDPSHEQSIRLTDDFRSITEQEHGITMHASGSDAAGASETVSAIAGVEVPQANAVRADLSETGAITGRNYWNARPSLRWALSG